MLANLICYVLVIPAYKVYELYNISGERQSLLQNFYMNKSVCFGAHPLVTPLAK